jgi:hypothetical protein
MGPVWYWFRLIEMEPVVEREGFKVNELLALR